MAINKRIHASLKATKMSDKESISVQINLKEEENKAEKITEILSVEVNKDSKTSDEMNVEQKLLHHIYSDLTKSFSD